MMVGTPTAWTRKTNCTSVTWVPDYARLRTTDANMGLITAWLAHNVALCVPALNHRCDEGLGQGGGERAGDHIAVCRERVDELVIGLNPAHAPRDPAPKLRLYVHVICVVSMSNGYT